MHGQERRRLATGTLTEFDHSYADTIAELGYPTRSALRAWWNEYKRTGEVPASRFATNPRHAAEMRRRAAGHYLEHGKGLARTTGALGYPKSRERPSEWVDELAPGRRGHRGPRPRREAISLEGKVRVVAGPGARDGSAAEIAERHGVSRTAPYLWRREMMGDSGGEPERKGEPAGRGFDDLPDGVEVSRDMLREAKTQPGRARPGLDVRQATLEIARKDPGADPGPPANAERAAMATAPGDEHELCEILPAVGMAKSSHGYARNAQPGGETEEHAAARKAVAGASGAGGGTYGHGRITARADAGGEPGGRVGERAVRSIMGEEGLVARVARRGRRHGSHGGGVPGAPHEPASRRAGEARPRGRASRREVGDRRGRVPHPGWQGLSLADRGPPRRHAAGPGGPGLARRGGGRPVAARRVRVAARGRPHGRAPGRGQPPSPAGAGRDLRGGRPGRVDAGEGGAAPATRGARASSAASR